MDRKKQPALVIAVSLCIGGFLLLVTARGMNPQVATWSLLAAFNHAPSEFKLGNHFLGTQEDPGKGIELMIESGEHGFGPAQNFLGWWYDEHPGNRGNYDYEQAEYWYNKAAAQGIMSSIHNLGRVYEKTRRFDLVEAQFLKAAEKDWANAQNSLGHWYYTNKNNKAGHDVKKAEYWFTKAAKKDHDLALHALGSIHRDRGEYDKAIGFFEKSYAKGKNRPDNQSAKALGHFYSKGPAPEYHNRKKALYWYNELAKRGAADDLYQAAAYYLADAGEGEDSWNSPQALQGMKWMVEAGSKGERDAKIDIYRKWHACFAIVSEKRRYNCAMMAAAENEHARIFLAVETGAATPAEFDRLRRDAVAGDTEAQLVLINLLTRDLAGAGETEDYRKFYILSNVFVNGSSEDRYKISNRFIDTFRKDTDELMASALERLGDAGTGEASACARLYNSDKKGFEECLYPGLNETAADATTVAQ